MKRIINILLVSSALCAACPLWAQNAEDVFNDARSYTVQIRVSVPVPFIDDDKGNFAGAGFVVDAARGWIMTNAHVVGRSPSHVEVAFDDDVYADATKLYVDPFLDLAILEVSSFQLESVEAFRPRTAVLLNITPDHLDRHADIDRYLAISHIVTMEAR